MTQHGIVEKINGTQITVSVAKTSMCGENCASCKGGCTPGTQQVQAINETGEVLHAGDSVLLETETGKILGASAVVYLVPLVGLFVAYFLAAHFVQNELVCALASVAALLLCMLCTRLYDRRVKRKQTLLVRITEILRKAEA